MDLKYIMEHGDIRAAYVLGCLEERMRLAYRYMHPEEAFITYPMEELSHQLEVSVVQCVQIMDRLEAQGYLKRKHDLAGPDKLYLPRLKLTSS